MKTISYILPILALASLAWTGFADTWQVWLMSILLVYLSVKADELATR